VFSAEPGASFTVAVREGSAFLQSQNPADQVQVQAQTRRYVLRPVGTGANFSVRARATRQIQVQVTDENDKPVPDVPVLFAVGAGGGGALGTGGAAAASITVSTNAQGIATTTFAAGTSPGTFSVSATIPGGQSIVAYSVTVQLAAGFFTATTITLLAVGAAAGTAVAVAARGNDTSRDTVGALPPDIRPK
jgi:hypothetical protein